MNECDYVINQYENGLYDLPEEFFFMNFKKKKASINNAVEIEEKKVKKEFTIDISKIDTASTKINLMDIIPKKLDFDKEEQEFISMFENGMLDKKIAQQYCIKKGKMLNAYINNFNEKHFSTIQKELIVIDDDKLRLNIETEENSND